jgi:Transposase DDE domain
MHVKGFLHKLLGSAIHKARIKALSEVVLATILSKELMLTMMGRHIDTGIQERSGIQKVNRLLGNKNLQREKKIISSCVSNLLIGNKRDSEIIVDWTKYPNSEDAVLRASVAAESRALTIYEERHPVKKMGNKKVQTKFLLALKEILPQDCKVIIVTDAGFHNDWFKEVLKLGWDYVGRIRHNKKYRLKEGKTFYFCKGLFKKATFKVKYLGEVILTRKNCLETHFYLVKSKLKGRKALRRDGRIKRDKDSKNYSRAHREPWLLVSSLCGRNAGCKVRRIYSHRMTIEEAFRDLKSGKYGFGLENGKTRRKNRRDILLLIGMLASLIAWLTGRLGEKKKLHYQFQSNSIKNRRVISLFYLGCQILRKKIQIALGLLWDGATSLKTEGAL